EASNSQRHTSDQNVHNVSDHMDEDVTSDAVDMDQYLINSWEDIGKIDFSSLSMKNICQLHFADLGLAFEFYNSYAKTRGFSVRKSRSRIVDGKVREKTYVCSCEGYRLEKWNHMKNRVREPKPETRCGCMSKLHVFFDAVTESWVVRDFCDEHNHELVVPKLARMLRSHKKMTEPNISQMNHMKEVGISMPNIFGSLASQCGISGYDDMGGLMEDSLAINRRACLAHWCKQIMNEGCLKGDIFNESRDALVNILSCIRAHNGDNNMMEEHAEYMYEDLAKNGSTEIETTRKPKRCSYCRKGGHNIATCSMKKMDERTPKFDDDAEENIEGEDYSFVDAESDEYIHTEWFEEEDEYLDSSRYYEQSGGETASSIDYDSG
ncbi:hypothetical protein S83_022148, partial [Arachis hypogaea]